MLYGKDCIVNALGANELALLRLIDSLTKDHGRPPTWAELALAAGLNSSSRGNIQRQLGPLRPTYLMWNATPRSLVLTDAARAFLGRSDASPQSDVPLNDDLLRLLACGLSHLTTSIADGRPLQAILPIAAQRSINRLAAACLMRGINPPLHFQEVLAWCRMPPSRWPLRFESQSRQLTEPLLDDDDQLTTLGQELADGLQSGSAEHELCEQLIGEVRRMAERRRAQTSYVELRRFLIEHAVISEGDLIRAANSTALGIFGRTLLELYERVPEAVLEEPTLYLCGHCGWTLVQRQGRLRCEGAFCAVITDNFTRNIRIFQRSDAGTLFRVRRAIRRYIVAPGIYELMLEADLQRLGITVELWPVYDIYDLRIIFPGNQIWAVDLKDWTYPHLLAPRLTPLPVHEQASYDRSFYVVPDIRAQQENYIPYLRSATISQSFEIVTSSELLFRARAAKEGHYA